MIAAIIAEALAHAESVTPNTLGRYVHVREDFPGGVLIVSQISSGRIKFDTHIRLDTHDAALAHLAERAERAEAALDAAERVAATRLDRINVLRLALGTVGGMSQVLALDDQVDREPARKCGPMVVSVDEGNGLRLSTETPFEYSGGRALRAKTSEANPGGRVRLWRLVLVEDWHRLPGEEDEKGAGRV